MSTLPPPPPLGGGPPPPPPPSGYGFPHTIPVSYAPVRATSGLRKAVLVLMWCAVASSVGVTAAAFSRKSIVAGFFDGERPIGDVDDADTLVSALALADIALTIAVAVVLAIWSYRTVSNGVARGAHARPGLAAGGWFIPIGWYWVGFGQLRKAMTRSDSSALGWWQATFVIAHIAGRVAGRMAANGSDPSPFTSQDDFLSDLNGQNIALAIAVVLMAIAAGFATKALREVDADTSGA